MAGLKELGEKKYYVENRAIKTIISLYMRRKRDLSSTLVSIHKQSVPKRKGDDRLFSEHH